MRLTPLVLVTMVAALLAAPTASAAGAYNDDDCSPSRTRPHPIVLVHGTFANGDINWRYMGPALAERGWCVFSFTYGVRGDRGGMAPIEDSARELEREVKRVRRATGARRVQLVGHSQGGMMPRYYLRFLGGARYVEELVGLAPSNHGTTRADDVETGTCEACAQQGSKSSFIKRLNRGREVERGVDYTVIQTRFDETVVPYRSAFLEGPRSQVTNVLLQRACPQSRANHGSVAFDPLVLQWVLNALRRDGPANPRFKPDCG